MSAPSETKAVLVLVLAATAGGVICFMLAAPAAEIPPRLAGWFLLLFGSLFLTRVAGQLLVRARTPHWLPPMQQWNLTPYRFLLPVQLVLLGVMAWLLRNFLGESGVATEPEPGFGRLVIGFSALYALAMLVRYLVRMRRQPDQRWFGGTIPIVFHWVLAAFLFVFGTYHASY